MTNWSETDLKSQLHNAVANGWLPYFEVAAKLNGFSVELLLGIASRETNMRNIKGDLHNGVYHGYGIMQVDIGTDPDFCRNWTPDKVEVSIQRGVKILANKRDYLAARGITDLKAIAAAYNTGEGNVVRSIHAGTDPDHTTTNADYGKDVLSRMAAFEQLRSPSGAVQSTP
jgi:soluble lytic murein transglycosylase-like protein